jgi:hypothetical protein
MAGCSRAAFAFGLAIAVVGSGPAHAQARGAEPLRPSIVRPDAEESLQWAASVVRLDPLRRQGVTAKLFGTAGGDPAMNGLYTYLAFFGSSDEGWRVFRLGDFLSYRLLAEAPGRLTLEVRESVMDQASGAIGERTRRLVVAWRAVRDEPPASVSVTGIR